MKCSQKERSSQWTEGKEEITGKGIEKEREVRFSVDIDIVEGVKREVKECKDVEKRSGGNKKRD